MTKDKKITVGLLVSGIMDDFSTSVCQGVTKAAQEAGVNLVIFPGKYLDRVFTERKEIWYEYQYNTVFSFAKKENLDAVLVSANSIGCFAEKERVQQMLEQYMGIPCVLIASQFDGFTSVNFDNSNSVKEAINYLIHELNCTKIGMIGGPKNNTDAVERKESFVQALEENGLSLPSKRYIEGDMSRYALNTYRTFISENRDIEAIFCVNDDTAVGLYEVLQEFDIVPGKDIYVLGYDNLLFATKMKPALSSIWADPVQLGITAFDMVNRMVKGEEVHNQILPTRFIIRQSLMKDFQKNNEDSIRRVDRNYIDTYFGNIFYRFQSEENDSEIKYLRIAFRQLAEALIEVYESGNIDQNVEKKVLSACDTLIAHKALEYADMASLVEHIEIMQKMTQATYTNLSLDIYRKLIIAIDQRYVDMADEQEARMFSIMLFVKDIMDFEKGNDQSYMVLLEHLEWLDIKNAYLYMYEKPIFHLPKEKISLPKRLFLKAKLNNGIICNVPLGNQETDENEIFTNHNIVQDDTAKVLFPLFSNETIYGMLLCDMTEKLYDNADFFINQMSSAVKMINLLVTNDSIQRKLEDSLAILKKNNLELDTLSKVDVLTGILNRRGFFSSAETFLNESGSRGHDTVVGYVDMNDLKIVNDRYGHDEGDFSIKKIGEILQEVIGENGIVGRIGGDEFAFVMRLKNECNMVELIYEKFNAYNKTSDRPYNITASVGIDRIDADSQIILTEALANADEMLYEEKKKKVKSVAK